MEAPTITTHRRVCAVCGEPQRDGIAACPNDGSTIFTTPSLVMSDTLPRGLPGKGDLLGSKLGDYEVQQIIGEGGMGIVYRGLQPLINKRVAIKVLRPEVTADATLVKRFLGEAQAVNAIGHRNIIDVFTLGQLPDGRPYIVMEFLEGTPLDRYLKERAPLTPMEAVELLLDISAPLQAAHTAGVIHRDLKPSNVFLVKQSDGTRYLKLLDFGLAKKSHDGHSAQTSANTVTGTPDYMSPEQARGIDVTPRSDLYSLGVIGYEMLTGAIPFTGATPMDVLIKHVQEEPVRPSQRVGGIPDDLEAVVLSLMDKDPARRLAPADKVRAELKRIQKELLMGATRIANALPGVGVSRPLATPNELPARLPGAPQPVGKAVWAALFVGLAVVGGGVAAVLTRPASQPVVAPPPPRVVQAPEQPLPEMEEEPMPVAAVGPSPVPPAPTPEPQPSIKPRPRPRPLPASSETSLDALSDRITRLEKRLKKNVEPGEEPDPAAMVLLKKIKVSLVTSHTAEERVEVQKSLDSWESTFLRK